MATTSLGTIPEDFPINGVYEAPVIAELPSLVYAMRPNFRELVWDADGGFADDWEDRSSLDGNPTDGYVFRLGRRAFSAASLAIFAAGVGGGGGPTELAGDVEGPSDANEVVALQGLPIEIDGLPTDGQVLTVVTVGDERRLVFDDPPETGDATSIQGEPVPAPTPGVLTFASGVLSWNAAAGAGDVIGPASAVDDRIATFDTTTGKLIQDGGKTIAQVEASAVATANTYTDAHGTWLTGMNDDYTVMANQVMANGANVINGRTWTGVDIGTYSSLFEIQNGLGVQMKANASNSGMYNTFRSMAHLKIKLVDFCPGIHLKSRIRVTAVIQTTGEAAGSEVTQVALGSWTASSTDMSFVRLIDGYISAANQNRIDAWRTSTYVDNDDTVIPTANHQMQVQLDDIPNWRGTFMSSPYSYATPVVWNDPKTFVYARGFDFQQRVWASSGTTGSGFVQTSTRNSPVLSDINEMCVMFSVSTGNTNNNTSLLGSLKALRIEYTK